MAREIKFRAWDVEKERWCTNEVLLDADGDVITKFGEHGSKILFQFFTGLHDKNGKEIYEGDILGADSTTGDYYVFWNDYKAAWDVKGGSGFLPGWLNSFTLGLEVIGNIYEHPHLLNHES